MSKKEGEIGSRPRGINFNQQEVHLLLDLVEVHKVAILNQATTNAANNRKYKAWMQIEEAFNEKNLGPERTEESLRSKWENLKRISSKQAKGEMEISSNEIKTMNRVLALTHEAEEDPTPHDSSDDDDSKEAYKRKKAFCNESVHSNEDKHSLESMDEDVDDSAESRKMVKNRSINFSPLESRLLLQCVRPEKKYILSTDITAKANLLKSKAWERVTEAYNKRNLVKRSHLTLRTKLENMKKIAKKNSFKEYVKDFGKKHQKLVNENTLPHFSKLKIKTEPISKDLDSTELIDDGDTNISVEVAQVDRVNQTPSNDVFRDPLSSVLNGALGNACIQPESKEVAKLQMELLNFQMETAKLERQRVTSKMEADVAEQRARELETALRLRAARLEATAAAMKLPVGHPALQYVPAEQRVQLYLNGGDYVTQTTM